MPEDVINIGWFRSSGLYGWGSGFVPDSSYVVHNYSGASAAAPWRKADLAVTSKMWPVQIAHVSPAKLPVVFDLHKVVHAGTYLQVDVGAADVPVTYMGSEDEMRYGPSFYMGAAAERVRQGMTEPTALPESPLPLAD